MPTQRLFPIVVLVAALIAVPFVAPSQSNDPPLLARQFVDLMAASNFPAAFAMFSPRLKRTFPEAEFRQSWNENLDQFGPFKQQLTTELSGERAVRITCRFSRRKRDIKVA